jgi:regulatory protein
MQSGEITAIEVQKRNTERANIYIDGDYAFSLTIIEAARLRKGQQLTEAEIEALRDIDAVDKAVDRAVRFLSYRPRSTHEVRTNLVKHDIPETVIDRAVERLVNLGYLDDAAFARFWVENRSTFKPLSPRALRYELRRKGVPDSIIEVALEPVEPEAAAYAAAMPRVSRYQGATRAEFQKKLAGFLQRRGFSYGISRDVIDRLAEECTQEDPDFFAPDEDHDLR